MFILRRQTALIAALLALTLAPAALQAAQRTVVGELWSQDG